MPHTEVMLWHQYARKHGGLPLQRLNFLLASLCTMFSSANGGKASMHDFLPAVPPPEPEEPDELCRYMDELYGKSK